MGIRGGFVGPGYGGDTALAWFHLVLWFVLWVVVIAAVVWAARELFRHLGTGRHIEPHTASPAIIELELRYARGEITREEYLTRRADLASYVPPGSPPPAI